MRSSIVPRLVAALLVGSASFTLYLATLAPTITWANSGADGGDLITAAATLGVPHPPGYPLYTTLGYSFAQLPIGSVAFRLNLFSAGCMALAAALITWCTTPIPNPSPVDDRASTGEGRKHPPPFANNSEQGRVGEGVIAGLAFAAAPMVWGQATITEVHALNALLVAVLLVLLAPSVLHAAPLSSRRLAWAFFVWGVSLTHQLTTLALFPLFFVAVRRSFFAHHALRITHYAIRITCYTLSFLLPLTLYLLLLSRAAAQPPINWLGEATPANFWSLITAELYRGYAFALPLSDYPPRLVAFAQLIVTQFGWFGLGLIGLGIYRARRRAIAPLISAALYAIFALGYNTADSHLYLIPVWIFCAYAIAAGAQTLVHHSSHVTHRASHSAYYALLICLIPALSVISNFAGQDLHADHAAEDFAQSVLAATPADAIIVTHLDAHTFTLWYYRHVEEQRPDVTIIDLRLAAYPWYDPMLRAQDKSLIRVDFDPEATWLARLSTANPTRPVCDLDPGTAQLHCP